MYSSEEKVKKGREGEKGAKAKGWRCLKESCANCVAQKSGINCEIRIFQKDTVWDTGVLTEEADIHYNGLYSNGRKGTAASRNRQCNRMCRKAEERFEPIKMRLSEGI